MHKETINERTIKVDGYGDYGVDVLHVIFPVGVTKQEQEEYLKENYLPHENTYYGIQDSDGRDCTGQVHKAYVEYDGRLVTITAYLDV